MTGVMGLAWASTTMPGPAIRPLRGEDRPADAAVAGDHVAPLGASFLRYLEDGDDGPETPPPVEAAAADADADPDAAPAPAAARERKGGRDADDGAGAKGKGDANSKADAKGNKGKEKARDRAAARERSAWRRHALATYEELVIVQPSPHVALVGFHEAAYPGARGVGLAARPDRHLGRRWVPHQERSNPLRSMVLPGRGRPTGSATAIDVAVPAGRRIFAPMSGRVTVVEPYLLYGRYPDTRIVITPRGRPDLKLVILHVTGHDVAVGDRVRAGRDVIAASATPFPFESQIDRFTAHEVGRSLPHVHLELRPSG